MSKDNFNKEDFEVIEVDQDRVGEDLAVQLYNVFEQCQDFMYMMIEEFNALFLVIGHNYDEMERLEETIREQFLKHDGRKHIIISGLSHDERELWECPHVVEKLAKISEMFPKLIVDNNLTRETRKCLILCEVVGLGMTVKRLHQPTSVSANESLTALALHAVIGTKEQKSSMRQELKSAIELVQVEFPQQQPEGIQ